MNTQTNNNELFPVFIKLNIKRLLIVGGGNIALEKINAVLNNSPQTKVTLVAPEVNSEIKKIAGESSNVEIIEREFKPGDLGGINIAIIAIGDRSLSEKIKIEATAKNIFVNVADTPDLCDFYLGSIITKGDLKIAVSTNGKSPTLAKRIRQYFQEHLPDDVLESIESLNKLRDRLRGDFAFKVKKLNEATQILLTNK